MQEEKARLRHDHANRHNEVANALYPRPATSGWLADPGQTRMMVSRHPFRRLVSAFRDKFERVLESGRDGRWFYELHGREMVLRYRAEAYERFGDEFFGPSSNYGTPLPVDPARGWRDTRWGKRVQGIAFSLLSGSFPEKTLYL